jgi:hypothetical protein
MSLCKYKDAFGKPGQGIHSFRIFGIAVADVLLTVLAAYGISKYFGYAFSTTTFVLFLLGIVMHRLFCVETPIQKLLFPKSV